VYILLLFVNLCLFHLYRDMNLFGGSSRLTCTRRVFMLREIFAGVLPAHPALMSVRKCQDSRDTREGGASEESWALRDSYCMEKHFCYVCTRG